MGNRILFAALACAATTALAGETPTVNPSFLWNGSTDTTGRVITGSPEATSGYWFNYNDANDNGTSRINFPPEFDMNTFDYGLMAESLGGIKATVVLGEGAEKPYVGFGFNIWNEDQKGVDITAWGGICLEYSSGVDFKILIVVENENTVTAHEDFSKTVGKADSLKVVDYEWKDFYKTMGSANALSTAAVVKLQFEGAAGTTGDFFLKKIGSHGQCSGSTDAIKPAANPQVNVSLSGRMVNFEGVAPSAKASVVNLWGQVVKSATASGAMDLSALPAGIYMLRVQGQSANYIQRIILK